jgi:hypothetical protein
MTKIDLTQYRTVRYVASWRRVHPQVIRDEIKAGRYPGAIQIASKPGKPWYIPNESIANFKPRKSGRPRKNKEST